MAEGRHAPKPLRKPLLLLLLLLLLLSTTSTTSTTSTASTATTTTTTTNATTTTTTTFRDKLLRIRVGEICYSGGKKGGFSRSSRCVHTRFLFLEDETLCAPACHNNRHASVQSFARAQNNESKKQKKTDNERAPSLPAQKICVGSTPYNQCVRLCHTLHAKKNCPEIEGPFSAFILVLLSTQKGSCMSEPGGITVKIDHAAFQFAGRCAFRFLGCTDFKISTAGGLCAVFSCTKRHRILPCVTPRPKKRLRRGTLHNIISTCCMSQSLKILTSPALRPLVLSLQTPPDPNNKAARHLPL